METREIPVFTGKNWGIYWDQDVIGLGIAITLYPGSKGIQLVFLRYIFQMYTGGKE